MAEKVNKIDFIKSIFQEILLFIIKQTSGFELVQKPFTIDEFQKKWPVKPVLNVCLIVMEILTSIVELILDFVFSTVVLWLCSYTVTTPNANFKTAAIYNGIMTAFIGLLLVIAIVGAMITPFFGGLVGFLGALSAIYLAFWLMIRLYEISFLSVLWLFIVILMAKFLVSFILFPMVAS